MSSSIPRDTHSRKPKTSVQEQNRMPTLLIYVSGANIFLHGYNGEYYWDNNANRWKRDEHFYFGYWISPSYIDYDDCNHSWRLYREDTIFRETEQTVFHRHPCADKKTGPLGRWRSGITVCDTERPIVDLWNNWGYMAVAAMTVVSICLFGAMKVIPFAIQTAADHANDQWPLSHMVLACFGVALVVKCLC